jgi:hypothetical protein
VLLLLQYKWLEADLQKVNRSVSLSFFRNIPVTNAAEGPAGVKLMTG